MINSTPPASTQDFYDRVVAYFSQDGAQIARDEAAEGCMYRTPDDRACAIGCTLPDELYDPQIERNPVGGLLENNVRNYMRHPGEEGYFVDASAIQAFYANVDFGFMVEAQDAHDRAYTVQDFLANLTMIAKHHGLSVR